MSFSKIFSGNLPELTENIIKYFRNDFSTLYSCVLVNRFWCRLAIPLLWENPFSITEHSIRAKNHNFIGIYLHNLNDELKTELYKYNINDNLLPSNTLFNYPSFIKYLNLLKIPKSVIKWFKPFTQKTSFNPEKNIIKLIIISLSKMFIENEVNLHTLKIEINTSHISYIDDILELFLQNTNFISNIKNLKLSIIHSYVETLLVNNRISQIINSHQNLKKIVLCNSIDDFLFYQSLLLSKDCNCSNTLNTITLYNINLEGMINLNKMFEQLNVLESVHIIYCHSLNTNIIQQIINLTKPFKLKSLFMDERSKIDESLSLLLQKSGDYLENLCVDRSGQQIFESVTKYCKNIKFFKIHGIKDTGVYPVLNLVENTKQNLNCLIISNKCLNGSSIILKNLGQILPSKLEYLDLTLFIKASDFEVFLKDSKGTFIKKLLIRDLIQEDKNNILTYRYIKEYIMKEKRVRYLNFSIYNYEELFHFSEEAKEFKLHNIEIQSYNDLYINIYRFAQKLD
ncbi:unnamed protein product [Rhizophagus irregularis]|nr:unnamed protein product [Rhizophagus irregularis]